MNQKLKSAIKNFLIFDALLTVFLFATIGVEGMARLACHFYNDPVCKDLEEEDKAKEKVVPAKQGPKHVRPTRKCSKIAGQYKCEYRFD